MLRHLLVSKHISALTSICFLVSACATHQQEAAKPEQKPQLLTVKSSHGTQQIMPTVVAYEGPPSSQDGDTAQSQQQADFNDPLEWINRPIFTFNDVLYSYLLIPVSHGYNKIMPTPLKTGVSNFFANIREPINGINNMLQGKGSALVSNLSRFVINSTIGILGLFDPAKAWFDIDAQISHVDDTMRNYNMGYGSYLVLPILGSSDLRNGFSSIVESMTSPIHQISDYPQTLYLQTYEGFHGVVPKLISYEELGKNKEDPYVFFRNLYMQSLLRDSQFPVQEIEQQKVTNKDEDGTSPQAQDSTEQP